MIGQRKLKLPLSFNICYNRLAKNFNERKKSNKLYITTIKIVSKKSDQNTVQSEVKSLY